MDHAIDSILGIDTSNYRTSICLIDLEGQVLAEARDLLQVQQGERGLQQSEAVFQHVMQLPKQMERIFACRDGKAKVPAAGSAAGNQVNRHGKTRIVAAAVSTAPRPVPGSYMPVFRVGEMAARSLAAVLGIPLYETTHQEGHIAAGEYSAEERPAGDRFLAVHLSGGTSEILLCTRKQTGYTIEKLGGTNDLHAGQLIDRIGVALGLPFPAGPALEKLAAEADINAAFSVPSSVSGFDFHLSGPETALLRAVESGKVRGASIARAAEQVIANSLEKSLRFAVEQGYPKEILIVGGVASNTYIKQRLKKRLEHKAVGCRLFFTQPAYSGDNAYGVAMLGLLQWRQRENTNIL